jgi:hypothetical protein
MNKTLLAALNDSERLLVAETELPELRKLDEDGLLELHVRISRARKKYLGLYRRGASAKVGAAGGRGLARPTNQHAAAKAEAFEEALSRVSRRLAAVSRQSATELRQARLAAARAAKVGQRPQPASAAKRAVKAPATRKTATPAGDRALRSPAREKARASTQAATGRRQAKKDSR